MDNSNMQTEIKTLIMHVTDYIVKALYLFVLLIKASQKISSTQSDP